MIMVPNVFLLLYSDIFIPLFYLAYFNQPFFQPGVIAQSADDVATILGVPYFSSAGNSARASWEGAFRPSGILSTSLPTYTGNRISELHDFGSGNVFQTITFAASPLILFQWDEPFASVSGGFGSRSDLDLLFFTESGTYFGQYATSNVGGDALEFGSVEFSGGPVTIKIAIGRVSGPNPGLMKWIVYRTGINFSSPPATASTCFGHPNMPNTAGVGAAFDQRVIQNGFTSIQLEGFSSAGGTPIIFDRFGNRLAQKLVLQQPRFVGADG
jgi:hypothetical protein